MGSPAAKDLDLSVAGLNPGPGSAKMWELFVPLEGCWVQHMLKDIALPLGPLSEALNMLSIQVY